MQLNVWGHYLSISFSRFTPAPLLRWWIIFTGKSTQSQCLFLTAVSQRKMSTLLQYKQMFTTTEFAISRYQNIPLLIHSWCFMWDRIKKFFRCFLSRWKAQDHYSDLDLKFRKQQLLMGTQMADMMAMLWRITNSLLSSAYHAECKHLSF